MTTSRKFRELRPVVAAILLRDWDPIGIHAEAQAQSEYDAYVPGVIGQLARSSTAEELAAHLSALETDEMGLDPVSLVDRLAVASKLIGAAIEQGVVPGPYPCPACGFLSFQEPPGSYDICPVCGWEDDAVQLRHPALTGGANRQSLVEAQRHAIASFPKGLQLLKGLRRDPAWRPLTDAEARAALATLTPGGRLPAVALAYNDSLYYWVARPVAG